MTGLGRWDNGNPDGWGDGSGDTVDRWAPGLPEGPVEETLALCGVASEVIGELADGASRLAREAPGIDQSALLSDLVDAFLALRRVRQTLLDGTAAPGVRVGPATRGVDPGARRKRAQRGQCRRRHP